MAFLIGLNCKDALTDDFYPRSCFIKPFLSTASYINQLDDAARKGLFKTFIDRYAYLIYVVSNTFLVLINVI